MGPAFPLTIGGNYRGPGESSLTLVSLPAGLAGGGSRARQSSSLPFEGPSVSRRTVHICRIATAITGNFSAARSLQRQPIAACSSSLSLSPLSPLARGACRSQMARNIELSFRERRIELIAKIRVTFWFDRFSARGSRNDPRTLCAAEEFSANRKFTDQWICSLYEYIDFSQLIFLFI